MTRKIYGSLLFNTQRRTYMKILLIVAQWLAGASATSQHESSVRTRWCFIPSALALEAALGKY